MKLLTPFVFLFIAAAAPAQNSDVSSIEPTSLYLRANELLNAGDTRNAEQIFKDVILFYKKNGRARELSENYLGMALAFAFHGHYNSSIRFHKKALRAHNRYRGGEADDAIRLNLGLTYHLAGKSRKAKKFLGQQAAYTSIN